MTSNAASPNNVAVYITWSATYDYGSIGSANNIFGINSNGASSGAFNPPTSDSYVSLTASFRLGNSSGTVLDTKDFPLYVLSGNATINAAKNRLTWDQTGSDYVRIRKDNDIGEVYDNNKADYYHNVTGDLDLPTTIWSGVSGSGSSSNHDISIAWSAKLDTTSSSNSSSHILNMTVGDNLGKVTRQQTDQYVILTATLTFRSSTFGSNSGLANNTKDFKLLVKAGNAQQQVDAVRNWLTWDRIRSQNTAQTSVSNTTSSRYNITSNLLLQPTLPTTITYSGANIQTEGITIEWSISGGTSSATVNTANGLVTFPASGTREVVLTATIKRGTATVTNNTKVFYLTLYPSADQTTVNSAISWLTWNQIRKGNDANSSATGPYLTMSNLTLPTSYVTSDNKTVNIRWTTSHSNIVRTDGTVIPPSSSTTVTLTAVFTYGSITDTSATNNPNAKTFSLTVRTPTNTESVRMAKEALTWDIIKGNNTEQAQVRRDLSLPISGESGTSISWSSSRTEVISNIGRVTRPTSNTSVTLTATIERGTSRDTKTFTVTVIAAGAGNMDVTETSTKVTAQATREDFLAQTTDVTIKSNLLTVSFDTTAVGSIALAANGDITVTAERVDASSIPAALRDQIGDRPVFDIEVTGGNRNITTFNGGTVTVRIPYTLRAGENANAIIVYCVSSNGNLELMRGYYDTATREVVFQTKHFSRFGISYNLVLYNDVPSGAWYKDAVEFITARKFPVGITGNNFEPSKPLTRGEFTAALMNAYGIELDAVAANNFSDVDANAPYARHLATGKRLGIISGVGDNKYMPERVISRQEMFALLYNILGELKELPPPSTSGHRLSDFSDAGDISPYLVNAIEALLLANKMTGSGGKLSPTVDADRAQMASMIYNMVGPQR